MPRKRGKHQKCSDSSTSVILLKGLSGCGVGFFSLGTTGWAAGLHTFTCVTCGLTHARKHTLSHGHTHTTAFKSGCMTSSSDLKIVPGIRPVSCTFDGISLVEPNNTRQEWTIRMNRFNVKSLYSTIKTSALLNYAFCFLVRMGRMWEATTFGDLILSICNLIFISGSNKKKNRWKHQDTTNNETCLSQVCCSD